MAISLLNRPNLEDGSASFYARWAVVGAGIVVSTILFRFLLPSLGSTAGAVTLLPILAAAMLLRTRCTIIAGVLACAAINAVTYFSFGTSWSLSSVVTGGATVIGVGVIVARLRELQDRVASAEQQRAIAEARARLSTAERLVSLGTLAAGIAHEVNNPLAFILANVRFARSSILEGHFELERAEVVKALEESEAGAMRMHAIVSDMKRLARDGAGDVGESDPRRVVESALNLISGEVKSAQVEKTYDPTPMVAASDARLGQIVLNLLTNALQSFATDSLENRVRVRVGTDERGWAVVEVADNGSGITLEVQKRMFDPFFTTKPPGIGTGLGLPLCQSFVQALGGTLTFQSELGKGTAFRVSLPPAHLAPPLSLESDSVTRLTPVR